MNPLIRLLGIAWLRWLKWPISRLLSGRRWSVGFDAIGVVGDDTSFGEYLNGADDLSSVVSVFRGVAFWKADPAWQLWDRVYPPALLVARGGDDCDGWAMLHARAIEYALGCRGWSAAIGSYLADPWQLSHHVALAIDPAGFVWAIQPPPTRDQANAGLKVRQIYGPYETYEDALGFIASTYGARVVWYDIRRPDGSKQNVTN